MAPCQTFVSLVRSCYTTTMRFFKDDVLLELPVRWQFTDPGAKWVGKENIFNSRNWYLGDDQFWPALGEVQGASRSWVDGSGLCHGFLGPFGTDEQWIQGALSADALAVDPCVGPLATGFPVAGVEWFLTNPAVEALEGVQFGPDIWAAESFTFPGFWYTTFRLPGGPACCFPSAQTFAVTSGPPAFTILDTFTQIGAIQSDCAGAQWFADNGSTPLLAVQIDVR